MPTTDQRYLNAAMLTRLNRDLREVANLLCTLRGAADAGELNADDSIKATIQKAGALTDRCIGEIGGEPLIGDFYAWAELSNETGD